MEYIKPRGHLVRMLVLLICLTPFAKQVNASDGDPIRINQENLAKLSPADQARVLTIVDRLETITAMDRSDLTRAERGSLRQETRELRNEARAYNRGGTVVYISAGTIIIILLIILILA